MQNNRNSWASINIIGNQAHKNCAQRHLLQFYFHLCMIQEMNVFVPRTTSFARRLARNQKQACQGTNRSFIDLEANLVGLSSFSGFPSLTSITVES